MQFSSDRTGFPLARVPEAGVEVHLLPVTKVQVEQFIAEPNRYGDRWYEQVLAVSPRVSYRKFGIRNREGVFATGLLCDEAHAFARWLGGDFRLLSVDQWRAVHAALAGTTIRDDQWEALRAHCHGTPAGVILDRLGGQLTHRSWVALSLMVDGVVEWVLDGDTPVGLGKPRPEFHPNLWDPMGDPVRPASMTRRLWFCGARLCRPIG